MPAAALTVLPHNAPSPQRATSLVLRSGVVLPVAAQVAQAVADETIGGRAVGRRGAEWHARAPHAPEDHRIVCPGRLIAGERGGRVGVGGERNRGKQGDQCNAPHHITSKPSHLRRKSAKARTLSTSNG